MVRYHNSGTQKFDDTEHDSVSTSDLSAKESPFFGVNGGHEDFDSAQDAIDYADAIGHKQVVFPPGVYGAIAVDSFGMTAKGIAAPRTGDVIFESSDSVAVSLDAAQTAIENATVRTTGGAHDAVDADVFMADVKNVFVEEATARGIYTNASNVIVSGSRVISTPDENILLDSNSEGCVVDTNSAITVIDDGIVNVVGDNS
jgi:hypothetical protein